MSEKKMNSIPLGKIKENGKRERTGKKKSWKIQKGLTVSLETLNKYHPTLLTLSSCITVPSTFDNTLTTFEWSRQFSRLRKKLRVLFKNMICPDQNIFILDNPEPRGLSNKHSMTKVTKMNSKKSFICITCVFNNDSDKWLTCYSDRINEYLMICRDEILKLTGYE